MKSALYLALAAAAVAQTQPSIQVQTNTFNSSFKLSDAQIQQAQLSQDEADQLNIVYNSDNSQLANGGPSQDSFYSLPDLKTIPTEPGVLLKTQDFTNTTSFVIPPNTALSRIIYTSTNLNGTIVPASSFVLWPYIPRKFDSVPATAAPVVLWTHGTSGFFGPSGPSTNRQLFYEYNTIFSLAQQGYAVVAPDFAGLGYTKNLTGNNTIPHQYLASPVSARDSLYGLQASKKAFSSRLSEQFVTFGHSQGGGVAWAVAEVLDKQPELGPGYLGTIAASPVTNAIGTGGFVVVPIAYGLTSVFPGFDLSTLLTPLGVARAQLLQQLQAGLDFSLRLLMLPGEIVKPDAVTSWQAVAFGNLANAGNKTIKGPLLITQGTNDSYVSYDGTVARVKETCKNFPQNDLSLVIANNTAHTPSLSATHQIWSQWIADRFEGKAIPKHDCGSTETLNSFLPYEQYRRYDGSLLQWIDSAEYNYQSPLLI